MHMENGRMSSNVIIDCLGKQTKFDGSAESRAANACQAEVNQLREKVISQDTTPTHSEDPRLGKLKRFDRDVLDFEQQNGAPGLFDAAKGSAGQDTFESRQKAFEAFINGKTGSNF